MEMLRDIQGERQSARWVDPREMSPMFDHLFIVQFIDRDQSGQMRFDLNRNYLVARAEEKPATDDFHGDQAAYTASRE